VRLATIEAQSKKEARAKIYAVKDKVDYSVKAVAQGSLYCQNKFQPCRQGQPFRVNNQGSSNLRAGNFSNWRSNAPGNNLNKNKQTCVFCKVQGHRQEDCRKEITVNKSCLDTNGKSFWPKVNVADNNHTQNATPVQALQDF
jgi:hypothetical protein